MVSSQHCLHYSFVSATVADVCCREVKHTQVTGQVRTKYTYTLLTQVAWRAHTNTPIYYITTKQNINLYMLKLVLTLYLGCRISNNVVHIYRVDLSAYTCCVYDRFPPRESGKRWENLLGGITMLHFRDVQCREEL